jgi:RimJ/RimL family protein N-acetyltransferase
MRFIGSGLWDREYALQRHELAIQQWAITETEGVAFLGLVSLTDTRAARLDALVLDIGWWVEPHAWGRGIASEAAAAVRDEAFGRTGASSLTARFHSDNGRSERIMEKLGMSYSGEGTDRYGQPARVYAMTRAGWMAISASHT